MATDGTCVSLPSRQRVLLAVLLLHANRIVPARTLARALWEDAPPPGARNTLHGHVRRLRQMAGAQGGKRIVTRDPGYLITVEVGELDLDHFSRLCGVARSAGGAGDWAAALEGLDEALSLWRGEPLADVASQAVQHADVPRLRELRLQAVEARNDAALRLGRHAELVAELGQMAMAEPMREPLHAQLMLALYRSGRQAEALATFRDIDRLLRDQLGIDPGPALRRLHQRILTSDAALTYGADQDEGGVPRPVSVSARPALVPVPAQLPPDTADFTGRRQQLELLHGLLAAEPDPCRPGVVTIAAITGMAGVGKTALAVRVAHGLRGRFPDGQLFVNLRGTTRPLTAGDVLARFLRDLGVPDAAIPPGQAERSARYRSELDGKRVLIVLDDARDEAQVRSLLPGSTTCGVIVTSRRCMVGLPGETVVEVPLMDDGEAYVMLARVMGIHRAAIEPIASMRVLEACAGLPLAIRIAASRLLRRPGWNVAHLAGLLADRKARLAVLTGADMSLRASFARSYATLPAAEQGGPDPARVFRLLGMSGLDQIGLPAITALAGSPADQVLVALEALTDARLLDAMAPGQYRLHHLLGCYAAELAEGTDTRAVQAPNRENRPSAATGGQ